MQGASDVQYYAPLRSTLRCRYSSPEKNRCYFIPSHLYLPYRFRAYKRIMQPRQKEETNITVRETMTLDHTVSLCQPLFQQLTGYSPTSLWARH